MALLDAIIAPISSLLDRVIPDPKARDDAKLQLLKLQGDQELAATRSWLRAKANSIEGGTSEINLNIVAKRVLELPGG